MKILYSFRESKQFTKRVTALLSDDEYAQFQWRLTQFPDGGDIIPNGGGIRKLRCQVKGRGKRGGARVIYYLAVSKHEIFMLDIYAKNERESLSSVELKFLRNLVKEWLENG